MIHIVLIAVHATAAVVGFALGCVLMARSPSGSGSRVFRAYALAVTVAVVALITVVALDWGSLSSVKRIAFATLCALGIVLEIRTVLAMLTLERRGEGWERRFLGHVGFVLISLFDGFCIVAAIDLRLPAWLIAVVAVGGVAGGVLIIRAATARAIRTSPVPIARGTT